MEGLVYIRIFKAKIAATGGLANKASCRLNCSSVIAAVVSFQSMLMMRVFSSHKILKNLASCICVTDIVSSVALALLRSYPAGAFVPSFSPQPFL